MQLRRLLLLASVTFALAGCGDSHTNDDGGPMDAALADAGPVDAGPGTSPDAGPPAPRDAGPGVARIGDPCERDARCVGGDCVTERELGSPGGFCTGPCVSDANCPAGSFCNEGAGLCWPSCEDDACARPGWHCGSFSGVPGCAPGCDDSADCAAGDVCDTLGACHSPTAAPLGGCRFHEDCAALEYCRPERLGFPGGQCTTQTCTPGTDCGTGGLCLEVMRSDGILAPTCLPRCEAPADCRDGYDCVEGACQPACAANDVCLDSQTRCDLASGRCVE